MARRSVIQGLELFKSRGKFRRQRGFGTNVLIRGEFMVQWGGYTEIPNHIQV